MNPSRFFDDPLILRTIFSTTFMMACSALMSCGRSDMKEREHQHAAKEAVEEPNKIMMIQSRDSSYKKCFKFPSKIRLTNNYPNEIMFHFKNFGYISGTEKSPGIIGNAGTSMVIINAFHNNSVKERYINSFSMYYPEKHVKVEGEYKNFYLYDFPGYAYSAVDKDGFFIIQYHIGDGWPRSKEERINELKLIVDFIDTHTIPCQGES